MLILDKPKAFTSAELRMPLYHRGHLSLLAGTKIWLCLLPGTKAYPHIPEIIISPINFESWSDLWRIEVTLNEKAGVVHKILRTLREHEVNVLAEESSSIERQRYHNIELIVDARNHNSLTDADSGKRSDGIIETMPDLRRALLAELMDYITFWPHGEPRLKISRMKGLHEAAHAFDIAHRSYISGQGFRPTVEHTKAEVQESKGWITLPNDMVNILQEALSTPGKHAQIPARSHPSYLLVSDTKERYLRAYFIRPTDSALSVTIEHEEKVGALARITDAIWNQGFNILTSLSRLYAHGGRAQYELVLQPSEGMRMSTNEETLRKELEKALGTRELISEYKVAVSYKTNYTSPLDFKPITENSSARLPEPAQSHVDFQEVLERQYSALAKRIRSPGASAEDMARFLLADKLLQEERHVRQMFLPRRILFLSFAFEGTSSYHEKVIAEAESRGFEVTTAKKLAEQVHRDGIIRLISKSTAFLGLWTEEGPYRVGKKCWPSPWLHWELGVAAAQGLKPRLLISSKVHRDAWKVYPEVPHLIFDGSNFEDSLRDTLSFMAAEQVYEQMSLIV